MSNSPSNASPSSAQVGLKDVPDPPNRTYVSKMPDLRVLMNSAGEQQGRERACQTGSEVGSQVGIGCAYLPS